MRTPAGTECRYFYGDYFRGRKHEECRLLSQASPPLAWKAAFCATCQVPGILRANACNDLHLTPRLRRTLPFLKQQVEVDAYCERTQRSGFDPHIGCGECHPFPSVFTEGDPFRGDET